MNLENKLQKNCYIFIYIYYDDIYLDFYGFCIISDSVGFARDKHVEIKDYIYLITL